MLFLAGTSFSVARQILLRGTVVLIVLLGGVAPAAAECPARIFFSNGIDTVKADALLEVPILRAHVNVEMRRRGLDRIDESCFELAYATDVGRWQGIINTADQLSQDRRFTHIWRVLGGLDPETDADRIAGLQRLLSENINAQLDDPNTGSDLRSQLEKYSTVIDRQKVIVVAHSQGNAFANSAFHILVAGFDQNHPIEPAQFSITAVATPADYVATGDDYTTLYGDVIVSAGGLPGNTPADGTPCGGIQNEVRCHAFVDSYLAGLFSEPRIVGQIVDAIPNVIGPGVLYDNSKTGTPYDLGQDAGAGVGLFIAAPFWPGSGPLVPPGSRGFTLSAEARYLRVKRISGVGCNGLTDGFVTLADDVGNISEVFPTRNGVAVGDYCDFPIRYSAGYRLWAALICITGSCGSTAASFVLDGSPANTGYVVDDGNVHFSQPGGWAFQICDVRGCSGGFGQSTQVAGSSPDP
jgi:hypothetical protein